MAKKLRLIYVVMLYLLGLPIGFLMVFVAFMFGLIISVKERDMHYIELYPTAFLDGLKNGHKINMQWIKHGNNYTEWNFWEEKA